MGSSREEEGASRGSRAMNAKFVPLVLLAAVGFAACAGSPPPPATPPPPSDVTACTVPHGFALASESAGNLATDLDVAAVRVVPNPERAGQDALLIHLNDAAGKRVHAFTGGHVGEHVTISVGGNVVSRAVVRDPIDADVLLTGSSQAEVTEMRAKLCGS